jgi:histidinol phosphatase-like PHP family hydrolase
MNMYEQVDYHIHTLYLKCANETMTVPALVAKAEELGLKSIAVTDHLNAPQFLDEHRKIKSDLAEIESDLEIIFGVEVNVIDHQTGAVSIDEQQIDELGFELIIGGPHSSYSDTPDPKAIIDTQHRLMMAVVQNPLVDILVHPWWFSRREFDDGIVSWLTDLELLPDDYVTELGEAAAATGTAIEANGSAIFANSAYGEAFLADYNEYLKKLADCGALISISSDAHDIGRMETTQVAGRAGRDAGSTPDQLWTASQLR